MNQFKRAKVVMLPTKNKVGQRIALINMLTNNKIELANNNGTTFNPNPQHLHIISDDEIKEDDWYLDTQTKQIKQYLDTSRTCSENMLWSCCKKIIATTDTSLNSVAELDMYYKNGIGGADSLPQPSQQFIEKYIESYNKGEVISDVLVEYEKIPHTSIFSEYEPGLIIHQGYKLKIDKNNCITIKKIKDSWSREEVGALLLQLEEEMSFTNSVGFLKVNIKLFIEKNL